MEKMNFNYSKMDFRGTDDSKENTRNGDEGKSENGGLFYSHRSDAEEAEAKSGHGLRKDGSVAAPKPGDVKNGDLVSLLLAATPPYLYNTPLIPQTFFFSEMLKSFVQAKTERQSVKAQQSHHKRQRKRSWREMTPPKPALYDEKPLELTTSKQTEEKSRSGKRMQQEGSDSKYQRGEFGSSNFTAEKLANSSVTGSTASEGSSVASGELLPPTPPLWYPPLYPPHPPFGIDPLHFFIDLRVSAHVWDRKLAADKLGTSPPPPASYLGLHGDGAGEPSLGRTRHKSAFTVPPPRRDHGDEPNRKRSPRSVHYLMSNLRNIYKSGRSEGKKDEEAKTKDLRALIGLELVVDYVKQESDGSDDEERAERINVEQVPEDLS